MQAGTVQVHTKRALLAASTASWPGSQLPQLGGSCSGRASLHSAEMALNAGWAVDTMSWNNAISLVARKAPAWERRCRATERSLRRCELTPSTRM